jgi:hypothetical protein
MTDAAWLAGIIDGEGTFALTHGGNSRKPNLRLAVYNTAVPILVKVKRILIEAEISFYEKLDTRNDRRPCSNITIGTEGVLRLYEPLRPHLVRQTDRLDAAVTFLRPHYDGQRRVRWSEKAIGEWESLRATHKTR